MRRYIAYLRYLIRHRRYVRRACWGEGLYWRGLVHDLSKFRPDEFIPYARHFYNRDGSKKQARGKTGYYKPTDTGDPAFDFAWFLHQKRNRHHWQWWILPEDDGGTKIMEMDRDSVREMVCDWAGAGKAQGFFSPPDDEYYETRKWYEKNNQKMQLHPRTRTLVHTMIGLRPGSIRL